MALMRSMVVADRGETSAGPRAHGTRRLMKAALAGALALVLLVHRGRPGEPGR
ncbi:MAG TPA: hypothetical protein VK548_27830 [Candidatus Acidoferrum sp.]|nr:hypothetical protein [Candidatus Acidoferrum sp.]